MESQKNSRQPRAWSASAVAQLPSDLVMDGVALVLCLWICPRDAIISSLWSSKEYTLLFEWQSDFGHIGNNSRCDKDVCLRRSRFPHMKIYHLMDDQLRGSPKPNDLAPGWRHWPSAKFLFVIPYNYEICSKMNTIFNPINKFKSILCITKFFQ
jgi:hypothetical protein